MVISSGGHFSEQFTMYVICTPKPLRVYLQELQFGVSNTVNIVNWRKEKEKEIMVADS